MSSHPDWKMPLPEHTIQPSHISLVSVSHQIKNELEFVSNESFCNLMYQMSSVINAAVDIFDELSTKLASLSSRFDSVEQRVASMSDTAKQLPTSEDCLSVGLQNLSMQPFAGTHTEDSQVLHRNTKPNCMRLCYERAEPPPPLHVMDPLRDDGKTTSRLYSDPRFFFDLWSKEMLEECNPKKTPRKRRPKPKSKTAAGKTTTSSGRPADTQPVDAGSVKNPVADGGGGGVPTQTATIPTGVLPNQPSPQQLRTPQQQQLAYGVGSDSTPASAVVRNDSRPESHLPPPPPPVPTISQLDGVAFVATGHPVEAYEQQNNYADQNHDYLWSHPAHTDNDSHSQHYTNNHQPEYHQYPDAFAAGRSVPTGALYYTYRYRYACRYIYINICVCVCMCVP
ncbi:unnamed protein product [Schistocephalus solidus]|uniref:Wiskott-Aldrich syndrome protein family member n=1 Tax=Schistocephalus solidus TaxID=70667 RepID=A0A183TA07_SCHSO|nr:unnamed protein product [Schistocephalus solidus]